MQKKNKISPWDIICFLILPIVLSTIITYGFQIYIDNELAGTLTTIFSLIFTLLFGFAAILVGKIGSGNNIEEQVVSETFVSIVSATLLSLISAIVSIIIIKTCNLTILNILSLVVYSLSFITIMLLLLIMKRTYIIYKDKSE